MTSQVAPKFFSSPLLSETEAALILGITVRTLQGWRARGIGPTHLRVAPKIVRYRTEDIVEWMKERSIFYAADSPKRG
jgi:predicted DNA-binding transcriptional regulator AlpA